jgi:hypothetical protein
MAFLALFSVFLTLGLYGIVLVLRWNSKERKIQALGGHTFTLRTYLPLGLRLFVPASNLDTHYVQVPISFIKFFSRFGITIRSDFGTNASLNHPLIHLKSMQVGSELL